MLVFDAAWRGCARDVRLFCGARSDPGYAARPCAVAGLMGHDGSQRAEEIVWIDRINSVSIHLRSRQSFAICRDQQNRCRAQAIMIADGTDFTVGRNASR